MRLSVNRPPPQVQIRLSQQTSAIGKCHKTEIHFFLTRQGGSGRAAFDIHLAGRHHINSVLGRDRHPIELEINSELFLDHARDVGAEIDGIAYRPFVRAGKENGGADSR